MPRPAWPITGSTDYVNETDAVIDDLQSTADDHETRITTVEGWDADDILPDQSGNAGKVLTTDGSDADWADASTLAAIARLERVMTPRVASGVSFSAYTLAGGGEVNRAMDANYLLLCPIFLPSPGIAVDRIGIEVNVTGTATLARLGAYQALDATGFPGALIADYGEVSVGTTGRKDITISTTLIGSTAWGLVWLAVVLNGTAQLTAFHQNAARGWLGEYADMAPGSGLVRAFTYGALPDPAGTMVATPTLVPVISLRAA